MGIPEAEYVISELEQRLESMTQKVNELNTVIGQVEGSIDKQLSTIRSAGLRYEADPDGRVITLLDYEVSAPDASSVVLGEFVPNDYTTANFLFRLKSYTNSYYTILRITRKHDNELMYEKRVKTSSYTDYESGNINGFESGVTYVVTLSNNDKICYCDKFEIVKIKGSFFNATRNIVTSEISMKSTSTSFEGYAKLIDEFTLEGDGSFTLFCSLKSSTTSYNMKLVIYEDYDPLRPNNTEVFSQVCKTNTYTEYISTLQLRKGHRYSVYMFSPRYGSSNGYTAYCNLLSLVSSFAEYAGCKTIKSIRRGIVEFTKANDIVVPIFPRIDPSKTVVNIRSSFDGVAYNISIVNGLTSDSLTLSPTYTTGESVTGSTTYSYKKVTYELVEFY